jgi:outer membrane lipoprotein carrier protein
MFQRLALSLICGAALAVNVAAQGSELDRLVGALQAKYARLASLAADFTQIYNAPGERTRRESGRLLLKKPGRMRWDYSAPEEKLYVSDGKVIYEYVPAERLATRAKVKESSDLRAPFMFLLGRGNLRRDFKRIEFAAESPVRAGNRVLRLLPKRDAGFRELLIEVEPQTLTIARLAFVNPAGARSDFLFSNMRENVPATDAQFSFTPPAGVEVREGE